MAIDREVQEVLNNIQQDLREIDDRLEFAERRVRAVRHKAFVEDFLEGGIDPVSEFLDYKLVSSPANPPATFIRIFADTDNADHLTQRDSSGNEIDLAYLDVDAVLAVEAEQTLDLTGDVKVLDDNSFVVGHSAQVAAGEITAEIQFLGTTETDASLLIGLFSTTDALAPILKFLKSGDAGLGGNTVVADNEELGKVQVYGADGTDLNTLIAEIAFNVDDSSIAAGQIGGEIILSTATSGGVLTTAVTINNAQLVNIASILAVDTIQEVTSTAGVTIDGLLIKDEFLEFDEISAPSTPAANKGRLYVRSFNNLAHLFYKDESGFDNILAVPWETVEIEGWLTTFTNSGAQTDEPRRASIRTGTTGTSTARARISNSPGISTGVDNAIIDWSQRILIEIGFGIRDSTGNGIGRFSLGKTTGDGIGDLARRGIGIRLDTLALAGQVHDGTTLTTTATLSTLTDNQRYRLLIVSDGAGNVEWFLDGTSIGSTTGGPSTAGGTLASLFQSEVDNGGDAANQSFDLHYLKVAAW